MYTKPLVFQRTCIQHLYRTYSNIGIRFDLKFWKYSKSGINLFIIPVLNLSTYHIYALVELLWWQNSVFQSTEAIQVYQTKIGTMLLSRIVTITGRSFLCIHHEEINVELDSVPHSVNICLLLPGKGRNLLL